MTGGMIYNICDESWENSFSDLSQSVAEIAQSNFELGHGGIQSIISVKVNNVLVSPDLYFQKGDSISISAKALTEQKSTIEVEYSY